MTIADLVNHIKSLIALKLKKNDSKPIKISEGIFLGSIGALISDLQEYGINSILGFYHDLTFNKYQFQNLGNSQIDYLQVCENLEEIEKSGKKVLISCFTGNHTSIQVACCFLIYKYGINQNQAFEQIKNLRDSASSLNQGQLSKFTLIDQMSLFQQQFQIKYPDKFNNNRQQKEQNQNKDQLQIDNQIESSQMNLINDQNQLQDITLDVEDNVEQSIDLQVKSKQIIEKKVDVIIANVQHEQYINNQAQLYQINQSQENSDENKLNVQQINQQQIYAHMQQINDKNNDFEINENIIKNVLNSEIQQEYDQQIEEISQNQQKNNQNYMTYDNKFDLNEKKENDNNNQQKNEQQQSQIEQREEIIDQSQINQQNSKKQAKNKKKKK